MHLLLDLSRFLCLLYLVGGRLSFFVCRCIILLLAKFYFFANTLSGLKKKKKNSLQLLIINWDQRYLMEPFLMVHHKRYDPRWIWPRLSTKNGAMTVIITIHTRMWKKKNRTYEDRKTRERRRRQKVSQLITFGRRLKKSAMKGKRMLLLWWRWGRWKMEQTETELFVHHQ